ncbi:hypothetical protein PN499_01785 [Kamptonema animale CS-326]|uniref:hypothetical protein n=1 Tax=Kamptonema animale TaxID=92934 RepID=UPI00232D02DF|nr:hypothetical protein [Kamptonema animale]MDB9509936.1 hypothetical protein [Kamptonema animale CS-326]
MSNKFLTVSFKWSLKMSSVMTTAIVPSKKAQHRDLAKHPQYLVKLHPQSLYTRFNSLTCFAQ